MDSTIIEEIFYKLDDLIYSSIKELVNWSIYQKEYIGMNQYTTAQKVNSAELQSLQQGNMTCFFESDEIDLMQAEDKDPIYLMAQIDQSCEAQVYVNGVHFAGLDENRCRVKLPKELLSVPFKIQIEVFLPKAADKNCKRQMLKDVKIVRLHRIISEFTSDLRHAWNCLDCIDDHYVCSHIAKLIGDAVTHLNFNSELAELTQQIEVERNRFNTRISELEYSGLAELYAVGHMHIDAAWLWDFKETVRKTARSFCNALRLMDEYEEFSFSFSQPQLYEFIKEYYPNIFKQVKQRVGEGRWELLGNMWVESDCNLVSGESIVNQFLYGQDFYIREFGKKSDICWLPDVFGFPATLPQIFSKCGMKRFFTTKIHWQRKTKFPYGCFLWEGADGSSLLAATPILKENYSGRIEPEFIKYAAENNPQKGEMNSILLPYGYGDGGGGATSEMLESMKRLKKFPGMPKLISSNCEDYFALVSQKSQELPRWHGELYVETHRGTYTSKARNKLNNRKAERLLNKIESLTVLAGCCNVTDTKDEEMEKAIKNMLLLQFHDVLPGSSIHEVYEDSDEMYHQIFETFENKLNYLLEGLKNETCSDSFVVYNPNGFTVDEIIVCPWNIKDGESIVDANGDRMKAENTKDGTITLVKEIPGYGYRRFYRGKKSAHENCFAQITQTEQDAYIVENSDYKIRINSCGQIEEYIDFESSRAVVVSERPANDFALYFDGPEFEDAWNLMEEYADRKVSVAFINRLELVEKNRLRIVFRLTKEAKHFTVFQDIMLYSHTKQIDFVTKVDWHEKFKILRVNFPIEIDAKIAAYEIPFGVNTCPVYKNNPWEKAKFEVCGHTFLDMSEPEYGVSILNNCKYGFSAQPGELGISLIRGSESPDPDFDEGIHVFTYAFYPHKNDWRHASTVKYAHHLNQPLQVVSEVSGSLVFPMEEKQSFVSCDNTNLVISRIKPAHDKTGFVIHFYEINGNRGSATIHFSRDCKEIVKCNLVEEIECSLAAGNEIHYAFKPNEIVAFKVII